MYFLWMVFPYIEQWKNTQGNEKKKKKNIKEQ